MSTSVELVSSVGNSWIICRSKSYSGRIYYFNTVTGEAAWNLNETEVEKAKNTTTLIQSQTSFRIDNCPEPKDSPQDVLSSLPSCSSNDHIKTQTPSKVYNKQIINNKFPKTSYNYGPFPQYSPLNAFQFNMPVSAAFNSGIWNVSHPLYITPSPINQVPPVINPTFNNQVPVTNTSVTLSSRFKYLSDKQSKVPNNRGFKSRSTLNPGKKYFQGNRNFRKKFHNPRMDLRHHLLSKKDKQNKEDLQDYNTRNFYDKSSISTQTEDKQNSSKYLIPSDENKDLWTEESSPKSIESLDITPLKKLLQISEFELWYIVVDTNVVLNNVNFLHMLLCSDTQCHLMVPQVVMNKIQSATNSRLRTRAHMAAYFISMQVDANVAVIDKTYSEENSNFKDEITNCCTKLTNQGHHVVLLTDDIELNKIEDNTDLHVFTVTEIKNILGNNDLNQTLPNMSHLITNDNLDRYIDLPTAIDLPVHVTTDDNRSIKITILNEANEINIESKDDKQETNEIVSTESCFDTNISNENILKENDECTKFIEDVAHPNILEKRINVGIQVTSTELDVKDDPSKSKRRPLIRNLSRDFNSTNANLGNKRNNSNKQKEKNNTTRSLGNKIDDTNKTVCDFSEGSTASDCEDLACASSCSASNESLNKQIHYNNQDITKDSENESLEMLVPKLLNISNKKNNKPLERGELSETVMFEITSSAMEECLNMKRDEWISRFVQIMEEVMTQILQQEPPFILDTMLPPWTIYEATECVKRKFHYDNDIFDAATKMLNVLFEVGALRGKIRKDISPNKYMEMYSYGVYLIDTLQGVLSNSEDLQTAAGSLSKLLSDIQDPHNIQDSMNEFTSENIFNETGDTTCDDTVLTENDTVSDKTELKNNETQNVQLQEKTPGSISSPSTISKYNLRSTRKNRLQEQAVSPKVTFIRNINLESSFFTSLNLKKNINNINDVENESLSANNNSQEEKNIENVNADEISEAEANQHEISEAEANQHEISEAEAYQHEISEAEANQHEISEAEANQHEISEAEANKHENEPKVIRNFAALPEFEERLKTVYNIRDSWTDKSDMVFDDYEEFDYDVMHDEYYCDDDYDHDDDDNICDDNTDLDSQDNVERNKINFKVIVEKIEVNIKEAFSSAHDFCEKSYTTLGLGVDFDKMEMIKKAEQTLLHINGMCDNLNSILSRESSDSSLKIQKLLNNEEFIIEDGDLEQYRIFISKCLEQGNIVKECVELVIDAIKEIS